MTEQLHFHFSLSCIGEGHGNPLQCSCLENSRDRGAWWAAVYGSHRVGHDWSDLAAAIAVTRSDCSDFGAPKNKVSHCFHCSPIYLPWSDGTRCIVGSWYYIHREEKTRCYLEDIICNLFFKTAHDCDHLNIFYSCKNTWDLLFWQNFKCTI